MKRPWTGARLVLAALAACGGDEIAGGHPASAADYPFMAAIFNKMAASDVSCGGTVIASSLESVWILTAAHCVCSTAAACPRWVVIGETRPCDVEANERLAVRDVCQNPGYSPLDYKNDIAVIQVAPQARGVALAALAPPETTATATLLGWGQTETQSSSDELRSGEAQPIYGPETCKAYFSRALSVTDHTLCSREGVAACDGDSGGPLLQTGDAGEVQIGVAIHHAPRYCGAATLYTRVSMYREWLDSVITQPSSSERPATDASASSLCRTLTN